MLILRGHCVPVLLYGRLFYCVDVYALPCLFYCCLSFFVHGLVCHESWPLDLLSQWKFHPCRFLFFHPLDVFMSCAFSAIACSNSSIVESLTVSSIILQDVLELFHTSLPSILLIICAMVAFSFPPSTYWHPAATISSFSTLFFVKYSFMIPLMVILILLATMSNFFCHSSVRSMNRFSLTVSISITFMLAGFGVKFPGFGGDGAQYGCLTCCIGCKPNSSVGLSLPGSLFQDTVHPARLDELLCRLQPDSSVFDVKYRQLVGNDASTASLQPVFLNGGLC